MGTLDGHDSASATTAFFPMISGLCTSPRPPLSIRSLAGYNRATPKLSGETLSPAELAVYVNENPLGDLCDCEDHAQLFSQAPIGVHVEYLFWYLVDYTMLSEEERVPVQPSRVERATAHREKSTIMVKDIKLVLGIWERKPTTRD